MRAEALLLNGVYESVLREILEIQAELPDHIMLLQPYKAEAIARFREHAPSVDDPTLLLISTTDNLPMIPYVAEVVGWDDKRHLSEQKRRALNRLIWTLQPGEGGLYNASRTEGGQSVNLLHVRRLRRISKPFSVSQLQNAKDGRPLSDKRATAGGWVYVRTDNLPALIAGA